MPSCLLSTTLCHCCPAHSGPFWDLLGLSEEAELIPVLLGSGWWKLIPRPVPRPGPLHCPPCPSSSLGLLRTFRLRPRDILSFLVD